MSSAGTLDGLSREGKTVLAGAAVSVVGTLMPWQEVFWLSASGVDGNGTAALLLALLAAGLVLFRPWDEQTALWTALLGLGIALVALSAMGSFAGAGVYVTLIGGGIVAAPGVRDVL